jgi:dihydroorotate dehydrogenase
MASLRIRLPPLSFRSFTSASTHSVSASKPTSTLRRAAYGTLFALTAGVGVVYYFDSRAAIHRYLITPLVRNMLDPESAHKLAVSVLENGLGPRDMLPDDERLETEVNGAVPYKVRKLTHLLFLALGSNAVKSHRSRSWV